MSSYYKPLDYTERDSIRMPADGEKTKKETIEVVLVIIIVMIGILILCGLYFCSRNPWGPDLQILHAGSLDTNGDLLLWLTESLVTGK